MHEFPMFGEQKFSENLQRQAHFRKHHEFPRQIDGFLKGHGGDVITLRAPCDNSTRLPFRHCKLENEFKPLVDAGSVPCVRRVPACAGVVSV